MPNAVRQKKPGALHAQLKTHAEMSRRFRAVGRVGGRRATGRRLKIRLREPEGHRADVFKRILADVDQRKLDARRFGVTYRAALGGHDELVSTASVRELIAGAVEAGGGHGLTAAQVDEVNAVFDNVSRIRLPTAAVGYALSLTERMQHPTAPGTGWFAESASTASEHARHDRARRSVALDAAEEALRRPGATFEDVAAAASRAAIAYTLNEMAAPITARDVKPFSLRAGVPDDQLKDAVRTRESMKDVFVRLGGTQEPDDPGETMRGRLQRPWGQRRGQGLRSVSPPRFRPPSLRAEPAEAAV